MVDWNSVFSEQDSLAEKYAAIPAGPYSVVVHDAEATRSKSGSGNEMLKLVLKVQGGPHDGRMLWTNIVFDSSNAGLMRHTIRKLAACGVSRAWMEAENPSTELLANKVKGAQVEVDVEIRQYQGEDKNDVKDIRPAAGGTPAAAAPPSAPASASGSDIPIPDVASAKPSGEEPF